MISNDILLIFAGGFGLVLIITGAFLYLKDREGEEKTVEQRINRLTQALSDTARLVSEIEKEVKERESLATKLKEDVDTYNELIKLRKPEVEAVAQVLRGEIQQEGRRSFWQQFAVNFFFFLLGVGTTLLIGR